MVVSHCVSPFGVKIRNPCVFQTNLNVTFSNMVLRSLTPSCTCKLLYANLCVCDILSYKATSPYIYLLGFKGKLLCAGIYAVFNLQSSSAFSRLKLGTRITLGILFESKNAARTYCRIVHKGNTVNGLIYSTSFHKSSTPRVPIILGRVHIMYMESHTLIKFILPGSSEYKFWTGIGVHIHIPCQEYI
jgi:hypothetical protein